MAKPLVPLTIECSEHRHVPYSFVCVHLLKRQTAKWVPVDLAEGDLREVDWDYCCPRCYVKSLNGTLDVVRMTHPACMNCVRDLQKCDGYIPAIKVQCECEDCREKRGE